MPFNIPASVYLTVCGVGVAAGFFFGVGQQKNPTSFEELASLMRNKELAKNRVQLITFASRTAPSEEFPQIQVMTKGSCGKVILKRPSVEEVQWLLEQSANCGIDFDEKMEFISTSDSYTNHLVENGKRTDIYRNPPHCIIVNGEPADFVDALRMRVSGLPESILKDPSKINQTMRGIETEDGAVVPWDIRRSFHCGFPGVAQNH